jgi:class 3 adenylate cyclase
MTAAALPASRTAPVEGTIMFTDIVGFTEFNAVRGDAEAVELLTLQERIVREEMALSPNGGECRIVKQLGDGLMLWFADACDAIDTGLRLQERFEEASWETDAPLWVRIGLHHGQQTQRGEDLLGHDVNVASRIVNLADSGEVLASESTIAQAEDRMPDVDCQRLGPVVMKGIPTPINLFRVERRIA